MKGVRTFDCLSVCVRVCVFAHICVSDSVFWCRRRCVKASALKWGTTRFHSKSTHCWKLSLKTTKLKNKNKKQSSRCFAIYCVLVLPTTPGLRSGEFAPAEVPGCGWWRRSHPSRHHRFGAAQFRNFMAHSKPRKQAWRRQTRQWVDPLRRSCVIRTNSSEVVGGTRM